MSRFARWSIRPCLPADMPGVLALLGSAGLPTADVVMTDGALADPTSARALGMWVLEVDGSLGGVIGLERFGTRALLRSLAVAPAYRKQGLGHELVARLERDARGEGIQQLTLLTETAEAFFRSLGYTVIDRGDVSEELKESAEFRSLCPASATCMGKALSH